jgi:hypothetical protein
MGSGLGGAARPRGAQGGVALLRRNSTPTTRAADRRRRLEAPAAAQCRVMRKAAEGLGHAGGRGSPL